jgi:hypothetical protein
MNIKGGIYLGGCLVVFLTLATSVNAEGGFYSKYSTIRADIVGIRDATSSSKMWHCPEDAADYCDLSKVNKGKNSQLTGITSNFSYDGDGVNSGEQGTIYVEISQPSIYNPLQLEGVNTFKRGGQWLDSFSYLIKQGRLAIDLSAGEEKVHAKLWFLHMDIKVNLGSLGNNDWFTSGIYRKGYGEIIVLIRLMPQVIDSIYIKDEFSESGFNNQEHNLQNLFFGPHMVEAARVRTDGRLGPNKNGTSGVKWNSGSSTKLSYNPAETWGFPLSSREMERINQAVNNSSGESVGLTQRPSIKKSWFNRPVYFAVHFDHLKVGKHKRIIDNENEKVWVSPSTQIDAVLHTYIIGDWVNKPIDTTPTEDTQIETKVDDSFWTQLQGGFGLFNEINEFYNYFKWLAILFITSISFLLLNWVRVKLKLS